MPSTPIAEVANETAKSVGLMCPVNASPSTTTANVPGSRPTKVASV
ncbi:Uncharacterised protein [Mycobacteroides abscessus subsp. abscessus]|nr:Uncharacterised protein [Mycobacteroides abscessus subsp. abscessus]